MYRLITSGTIEEVVYNRQIAKQQMANATLNNTHDCYGHRSCDLPIDTIRPTYRHETGGHGIACAEVIHSIAPGAELHLVRVNGLTTLENAADWAVREGIDLVSMSMSFFNESFYDGTGDVNEVEIIPEAGHFELEQPAADRPVSIIMLDFLRKFRLAGCE